MPLISNITLIIICMVQFSVIVFLFLKPEPEHLQPVSKLTLQLKKSSAAATVLENVNGIPNNYTSYELQGVAVTLFLHSPTWFQRRNTVMVNNIRDNLPNNWKVQIFYMGKGQSQKGIDDSLGLKRLIGENKVTLTLIPEYILKKKRKAIHLLTESWLWEHMAADRVLLFGGNSVICSNSPYNLNSFSQFDYIGPPWDNFEGVGGEGHMSLRNRKAMVEVIQYAYKKIDIINENLNKSIHRNLIGNRKQKKKNKKSKKTKNDNENTNCENENGEKKIDNNHGMSVLIDKEEEYLQWIPDAEFFISNMIEMNEKKLSNYTLADRVSTLRYGAIGSAANKYVLVASGTLPVLSYIDRENFIIFCPDLKTLFPSLHDPHCFGNKPNGTKCAQSICALREPRRKGGC